MLTLIVVFAMPIAAAISGDIGDTKLARAQALAARLNGDDKAVFDVWRRHVAARPERTCEVADELLQAGEIVPAHALACPAVSQRALLALRDWWESPLRESSAQTYTSRLNVWRDATGVMVALPHELSKANELHLAECAPAAAPWAAVEVALAAHRATEAEYQATDYAATLAPKKRAAALHDLALLFEQYGHARPALVFARQAEAFAPNRVRLAQHYLHAGLSSEALELVSSHVFLSSASSGSGTTDGESVAIQVIDIRVRALRALGRNQEARAVAEAAIQAEPQNAASHIALARTAIDEDSARAAAALERAMHLDPSNDDAAVLLARWFGARKLEVELRARAVSRAAQSVTGAHTGPARVLAGLYRDIGAIAEARRMACAAGIRPNALRLTESSGFSVTK